MSDAAETQQSTAGPLANDRFSDEPKCAHRDCDECQRNGCCPLHKPDPEKEVTLFTEALERHVQAHGWNCPNLFVPKGYRFNFFQSEEVDVPVNFENATFCDEFSADYATFRKMAMFRGARFCVSAQFNVTTFCSDAFFHEARFLGDATFCWARFSGRLTFDGTTFQKNLSFSDARFEDGVTFIGTAFEGSTEIWFERCEFRKQAVFCSHSSQRIFCKSKVYFRGLVPGHQLSFWHADLSNADFSYSDVSKAHFFDVQWASSGSYANAQRRRVKLLPSSQQAAYTLEPKSVEALIITVDGIRSAYEAMGNYELAGRFRTAEKELRLLDPSTAWTTKVGLCIYRVFAGYGESLWRPLLTVLIQIACLAVYFVGTGDLVDSETELSAGFDSLPQVAYYLLQVATQQSPSTYEPASAFASIVVFTHRVVAASLAAVIVFVVGRRITR